MKRVAQFFFIQIGTFVAVIVFVVLAGRAGENVDGIRHAMTVGFLVMTGYVALAWSQGEVKQFDPSLWLLFAIGTLLARFGSTAVFVSFVTYFGTALFVTLGLTAIVPLLLGRETFVYYFARRQIPAWQMKLAEFHAVTRVMTVYWTILFFTAATLCAWSPRDPHYTFLYPNLLIFGLGITATFWLPPLYFMLYPPSQPTRIEPLIMGMPFVFDRRAARDVRASIQFCVSGAEAGDFHLRVFRGKCQSFEGRASAPDLTIYTPDTVWMRVARGELDGGQALAEGLYRAEGDVSILVKMGEWFPPRQPARTTSST